jgi:hypothetical protein
VRTRVLVLIFCGISVFPSPLSESLPLPSDRVNRKPLTVSRLFVPSPNSLEMCASRPRDSAGSLRQGVEVDSHR